MAYTADIEPMACGDGYYYEYFCPRGNGLGRCQFHGTHEDLDRQIVRTLKRLNTEYRKGRGWNNRMMTVNAKGKR